MDAQESIDQEKELLDGMLRMEAGGNKSERTI